MKRIIYYTMLAVFLAIPKLSFGWYVHVTGSPNTACPGTTYEYHIDANPNSGLLTISCLDCLIKNPETGA